MDEDNNILVQKGKIIHKYKLLHLLEFNSTRKRMSVIVKDEVEDKIILFTKGADSIIFERLSKKNNEFFKLIIVIK